ncbi:lipoyl synthase [bacterium]
MTQTNHKKKPAWLSKKTNLAINREMKKSLRKYKIHTVCESASCPNISDCFKRQTATFMIMGNTCTRACKFCGVKKGIPQKLDIKEPENIAEIINHLKIKYAVITTVTRDDLSDGGAEHFINVIKKIKEKCGKDVLIEILTSDFYTKENYQNKLKQTLENLFNERINVFGHNVETIPRLYPKLKARSDYNRSLQVLKKAKNLNKNNIVKTGIMVGLGETIEEVKKTIQDIKNTGCDILTIGQYLSPSKNHFPIFRYAQPEEFIYLKDFAYSLEFKAVEAGPYVRSSYKAKESYETIIAKLSSK